MKNTLITLSAAIAVACLGMPASWAESAQHTMVTPDELKWSDVPSAPPGAKVAVIEGPLNEAMPITFRLKFPADYKLPAHWHPGIEHVTVISGTFNMGTGDKLDPAKTQALPAGSVAIMQPKTNHFAWTKEETIVQVHGVGPWGINYVNPADDPRKK
ncbi:MAG: cupin domain-containing protein [Thiobacillaceae bacterium]